MKRKSFIKTAMFAAFVGFICFCAMTAQAQTTAFTYQGRFTDTSIQQPTNGTYTMTFRLFDAATGGNQIPDNSTAVTSMVSVINSIFTTRLDFGAAAFDTTQPRYLEIQIGSTVLTPRQEITSTPFALRSINAANADSLGGVAANQFVQTNDARLSDARTPTPGSSSYIQNTTAPQSANFNVSGSGVIGGKFGIGTTVTPTTATLQVFGGILARGGAPRDIGINNNGYAFSGNGGDNDSGMFSTADGMLQFYADNAERLRLTRGVEVKAGNGNNGSGGFDNGGAGAGITLLAGNGGDGNVGGAGANITLQGGNGGNGVGMGGGGAGITLRGGNGGNSNFSAGSGASITLLPGIGGSSTNQSPGISGNVILAPTNGNVGIGTINPTSKLSVNGDLFVTGTIYAALGQDSATVYGTGSLTVTRTNSNYVLVPGLTQTINVPANSALFISTDGGIETLSQTSDGRSIVDMAIFVDGVEMSARRHNLSNASIIPAVNNWALSGGQTLAAGSHTIEVRARSSDASFLSNAIVSRGGGADDLLRGQLTVTIIKK